MRGMGVDEKSAHKIPQQRAQGRAQHDDQQGFEYSHDLTVGPALRRCSRPSGRPEIRQIPGFNRKFRPASAGRMPGCRPEGLTLLKSGHEFLRHGGEDSLSYGVVAQTLASAAPALVPVLLGSSM